MGSFEPIGRVARILAGFSRPWFVSGGWAIDLFVGRVTREHADREVGIFRQDQAVLRSYLAGWDWCKAVSGPEGGEWVPWADGERLELPIHQLRAQRVDGEPAEFELFMNDLSGEDWLCRRNPVITRPAAEISHRSRGGIPFLVPEIQLLYKAKWHREKDEHDFQAALGLMSKAQHDWLRQGLEIIHPGDPWLAALSASRRAT
jgi:hypothetical protein